MDDFDFSEWGGGFDLGDMGGGIDLSDIDFSGLGGGFDLSDMGIDSLLNSIDLGEAISFGDVLGSLDSKIDFSDLGGGFDLGDMGSDSVFYDFGYGDLGYADPQDQDGGFYGNTPGAYFDPRTNLTTLYDESGKLRDFVTHEGGVADIGGGSYDVEAQPGGFYGTTPTAGYDPKTNTTTIRNPDGSTRVINHDTGATTTYPPGTQPPKTEPPKTEPPKTTSTPTKTPSLTKDNALLIALLGGLLGLLGKGSASKAPVGYQGGIPKYKSIRGEAMSPTAGGRRPGGANIPSLTGGYTLTKAAGGGLMDLAQGGRPARYLRGGTDGMADKIKTDIDGKQPARLSHGEFVIPADVVSHLGNGNSDAGADVLYDMMAKVRKARTGTTKQGKQINPRKMIPA